MGLMGQVNNLCERRRETFGKNVKECCLSAGNDGLVAQEALISTFDNMVQVKCYGSLPHTIII